MLLRMLVVPRVWFKLQLLLVQLEQHRCWASAHLLLRRPGQQSATTGSSHTTHDCYCLHNNPYILGRPR